jgi:hypothetical protein
VFCLVLRFVLGMSFAVGEDDERSRPAIDGLRGLRRPADGRHRGQSGRPIVECPSERTLCGVQPLRTLGEGCLRDGGVSRCANADRASSRDDPEDRRDAEQEGNCEDVNLLHFETSVMDDFDGRPSRFKRGPGAGKPSPSEHKDSAKRTAARLLSVRMKACVCSS